MAVVIVANGWNRILLRRTFQLSHSRRSGVWPKSVTTEYPSGHKCQEWRLLAGAPG